MLITVALLFEVLNFCSTDLLGSFPVYVSLSEDAIFFKILESCFFVEGMRFAHFREIILLK